MIEEKSEKKRTPKPQRASAARFFKEHLFVISLHEMIGEKCLLETDGDKIRMLIIKLLQMGVEKVGISFVGVTCSANFLKGALGKLIEVMSIHEINNRISLIKLGKHADSILDVVMWYCTEEYLEKKNLISLSR